MSALDRYANQTVVCTISGELNEYGDPMEGSSKKIHCRKEPMQKLITGQHGEVCLTQSFYMIPFSQMGKYVLKVFVDKLDDVIVKEVNTLINLKGVVEGYEAFT